MSADLSEKLGRLAAIAAGAGLSRLVLREPATLAWLLGARVHVPQTLDTACLDVIVDFAGAEPGLTIVTNAIEAPRLRDTELSGLKADWTVVPWWESRDAQLPQEPSTGSDRPLPGTVAIGPQVARARRVLTGTQQDRLRSVCSDAAAAATASAELISPTTTEYEAAGALAHELLRRALDPIALFVAGHERMAAHRHPLPTTRTLGRRAMLVCCARRDGLVGSVTRIVSFGGLTDAEEDAYTRLLAVEQAFLDATRPGAPIGTAYAAGAEAYGRNGFEAEEWRRHHQGGFSGFQPREYPAYATSTDVVDQGAVVAWNPSADGWKVEDTCLVGPSGPEPLVDDGVWPRVDLGGRRRPAVMVR